MMERLGHAITQKALSMLPRPQPGQSAPAYFFECSHCRRPIHVEPKQAGTKIDCNCGFMSVVPSVVHLKPVTTGNRTNIASGGSSPFAQPAPPQNVRVPNCPFCSRPMQPGRIIGERYQLKWLEANTPLTLGIWAVGGIPIGQGGFMQFNRPHVWGWRCAGCAKIIVDERA